MTAAVERKFEREGTTEAVEQKFEREGKGWREKPNVRKRRWGKKKTAHIAVWIKCQKIYR